MAVSIEDGVVGRNISEGDTIYVDVPERHLKTLMTKFPSELVESDRETVKELIQLKRRENPVWWSLKSFQQVFAFSVGLEYFVISLPEKKMDISRFAFSDESAP